MVYNNILSAAWRLSRSRGKTLPKNDMPWVCTAIQIVICRVESKTCIRTHADFVGYPHQSATLTASPKGSLYINRALSILNIILQIRRLRTNKIDVDEEAITTKASLGGSCQRS